MSLALTACVAASPLSAGAEAPADAAGEPAEAAEDPKDAADSAEETAEDADAAEDAETPEPPEIAIARPDAAQPAVQPGIAAPAIQPGGISVMLPGETRQVALNPQASNEDGTVMGDFETVVKNAKAGQEIILQEDYTGSLTIFDWIRLNLNKKTVTGTITVDLSGKKADGSRGTVEIVNGTITGGTESGVKITGAEGSEILLKDLTITGNRNDTSGYGGTAGSRITPQPMVPAAASVWAASTAGPSKTLPSPSRTA